MPTLITPYSQTPQCKADIRKTVTTVGKKCSVPQPEHLQTARNIGQQSRGLSNPVL